MAMLQRWDPLRDLARIQDEMSRLFDDRLGNRAASRWAGLPACDIFEDEEGVTLRFDLAGVDPKDVDIRFENGVLTLRGERKLEREEKPRAATTAIEMSYGTFTRSFSLPGTIDAEKIRAESRNGVLAVHLPKRPEAKPKSIQVKVELIAGRRRPKRKEGPGDRALFVLPRASRSRTVNDAPRCATSSRPRRRARPARRRATSPSATRPCPGPPSSPDPRRPRPSRS